MSVERPAKVFLEELEREFQGLKAKVHDVRVYL